MLVLSEMSSPFRNGVRFCFPDWYVILVHGIRWIDPESPENPLAKSCPDFVQVLSLPLRSARAIWYNVCVRLKARVVLNLPGESNRLVL